MKRWKTLWLILVVLTNPRMQAAIAKDGAPEEELADLPKPAAPGWCRTFARVYFNPRDDQSSDICPRYPRYQHP